MPKKVRTYEEAVRNGQEVIESLIEACLAEGWALPVPATLEMSEQATKPERRKKKISTKKSLGMKAS